MSLRSKKAVLITVLAVVVLLANAGDIVALLEQIGVVAWAQHMRSEYVTGTAITVILAMLFLFGGPHVIHKCARILRRCPVCDHILLREGRYCAACGSRLLLP